MSSHVPVFNIKKSKPSGVQLRKSRDEEETKEYKGVTYDIPWPEQNL